MVSNKSTEDLPENWIESVKTKNGRKTKIYTNSETGQKFYSKAAVMRYVNSNSSAQATFQELSPQSTPQEPEKQNTPQEPAEQNTPQQLSRQTRLATKDETKKETKPVSTNETPDWLPSGWIVDVKSTKGRGYSARKYKVYIEPSTGQKFNSKPEVLRHLKIAEQGDTTSKRKRRIDDPEDSSSGNLKNGSPTKLKKVQDDSINKEKEIAVESPAELKEERTDATLGHVTSAFDWLPSDWKVEIKTKSSGQKYKCFIDPSTGSKFYSKPEVIKFLNVERKGSITQSKKVEVSTSHGKSMKKIMIEKGTPDKLPSGWIKEIKIQRKGRQFRRDPFYTDPESRYVFRSQKDALLFLETGDINSCALKPKKREELDFLSGDISPLPTAAAAVERQKSQVQNPKKGRNEGGKQTDDDSGSLETENDNSRFTKRQRKSTSSNDETQDEYKPEDEQPIVPPPKSQSRRKTTSSRKGVTPNGNRTSGRKAVTVQEETQVKTTEPVSTETILPVQAEPISSSKNVGPSLAKTLNDALGLDLENATGEEETLVENSPKKDETIDDLFQFESSWCDIDVKEPELEPEPELELEPEQPAWLNQPLDFVLKTLGNDSTSHAPFDQDYVQQETVTNNQDTGAPSFTNLKPPSSFAGHFNFLQSNASPSINQSPANPLFMSPSPANPLFPPNGNVQPPPPSSPMVPPGGFGSQ